MQLREKIKQILREIDFSVNPEEFDWRYVQSKDPKSSEKFTKRHIYTFKTPKFKYVVYSDEYDYQLFIISFFPKLQDDFFVNQQKLASAGQKHYDEYSFQTKEQIPLKVFGLLQNYIKQILSEKPNASFGYFGAADFKQLGDADLFNTKRVRIYNEMLNKEFGSTHELISEERFSGSLFLNKEVLAEYPEIVDYGRDVLISHL